MRYPSQNACCTQAHLPPIHGIQEKEESKRVSLITGFFFFFLIFKSQIHIVRISRPAAGKYWLEIREYQENMEFQNINLSTNEIHKIRGNT